MATASKHTPAKGNSNKNDAIMLLKSDHDVVRDLFKQFEELIDDEAGAKQKEEIARRVCNKLKVHSQIEEEIFYPAVRAAIDNDELMDEAEVEHEGVQTLIAQIEAMVPGDDLYDAKVVVLGEEVEHHIQVEEDEIFPLVKKAKLDMLDLGMQMFERKMELIAWLDKSDESDDMGTPHTGKKKIKPTQGRPLS